MKRATAIFLLSAFLLAGCAETPYRESKVRVQHPQWDDATVRKVARRVIEPGMTGDMVRSALGIPDAISREGDEERWGYGVMEGNIQPRLDLVFFVYLRYGIVTRTSGDRDRLKTVSWYD